MNQREIKFRTYQIETGRMDTGRGLILWDSGKITEQTGFKVMQYTGLKDKNHPYNTCIFEGDIINLSGIIIGNQYETPELLKDPANLLIEGFGTKNWRFTEEKAMDRGCIYP